MENTLFDGSAILFVISSTLMASADNLLVSFSVEDKSEIFGVPLVHPDHNYQFYTGQDSKIQLL